MTHREEAEKAFLEAFNIPYPYNRPRSDWLGGNEKKIVARPDPHCPYQSELVKAELLKHHKDAETIIVTGDEGDFYSKSRYRKQRYVSFRDEVRAVFYDIEWMATHWKRVLIMIGNHDTRPMKRIQEVVPPDLMILTEQNLIKRVASYFDNVEVVGQSIGEGTTLTHIYQHGDIIFTHGEISRVQKTSTLDHISRYLYLRRSLLKLKPYKVIAQSHNHDVMKTAMGEEYWFLLPTASDPYSLGMEYIWDAKLWGKPPAVGYSIFYQDKGETDFNASDNVLVKV